jgi:hypothetical protein
MSLAKFAISFFYPSNGAVMSESQIKALQNEFSFSRQDQETRDCLMQEVKSVARRIMDRIRRAAEDTDVVIPSLADDTQCNEPLAPETPLAKAEHSQGPTAPPSVDSQCR